MSMGYGIGCDTCLNATGCHKDDKQRTRFSHECIGYIPVRIKDIVSGTILRS